MKPVFFAEPKTLSDDSIVLDVFVEWELKTLPGMANIKTRFFDKTLIHHAVNADEACALVEALNEAVEKVLGK